MVLVEYVLILNLLVACCQFSFPYPFAVVKKELLSFCVLLCANFVRECNMSINFQRGTFRFSVEHEEFCYSLGVPDESGQSVHFCFQCGDLKTVVHVTGNFPLYIGPEDVEALQSHN